ncbi:MAG: glyoxalase [Leptolyngbya sp.]|nr:MAG: glyoxalase [Leptolyngbya sp.]
MPLNYTAALVTIAAPNFDLLVDFYKALLTQAPTVYTANVYAEFQLRGIKLGIYRPKAHDELSPQPSALSPSISLCLEVVNLEAAIAYLTELGYPPPGEILTASHGREIYAYDPDGNRLILHQGFK